MDAVIFDCDGVLVDSEILGVEAERAALAAHGLHYEERAYLERFTGLHLDRYFAELEADSRAKLNRGLPKGFEDKLIDNRRREIAKHLTAVPGIGDAVTAFAGPRAVASSSKARGLEAKLRQTDLWAAFAPHVYSADLVPHGKPAPDIFLYTAEKIDVAPEGCLVIEDSVNGVLAGVAAGMTVWGFTGGGHSFDGHGEKLKAAGAAHVAPDSLALADSLRSIG